jgi:hypothetical protein
MKLLFPPAMIFSFKISFEFRKCLQAWCLELADPALRDAVDRNGVEKCSFSRPSRRTETRFASCRMERCFATAWRVMSSPRHSSPSVWPFFRCNRSSKCRRLASANARNTASSFMPAIGNHMVPFYREPIGCLSTQKILALSAHRHVMRCQRSESADSGMVSLSGTIDYFHRGVVALRLPSSWVTSSSMCASRHSWR